VSLRKVWTPSAQADGPSTTTEEVDRIASPVSSARPLLPVSFSSLFLQWWRTAPSACAEGVQTVR